MTDRPLPKGAGRVNCLDCGATVAADGKGTPMVLRHADGCPQSIRRCVGYARHVDCPLAAEPGDIYCEGCRSAVEQYRLDGISPDDDYS